MFLGAGIIAVLLTQIIVTAREFWKDRVDRLRERNGLLRILYSEFCINKSRVRVASVFFEADMEEEHRNRLAKEALSSHGMRMKAWEDTRVELARHLPSGEFAILASHYRDLEILPAHALKDLEGERAEYVNLALILEIQEREQKIERIIRNDVPDVTSVSITMRDYVERQRSLDNLNSEGTVTPPVQETVRSSW